VLAFNPSLSLRSPQSLQRWLHTVTPTPHPSAPQSLQRWLDTVTPYPDDQRSAFEWRALLFLLASFIPAMAGR
jgi:hypothetical protein